MSGSKSESQTRSESRSGTFVEEAQAPYLEFLRSQGQSLTERAMSEGSDFQQRRQAQDQALQGFLAGPQENPYLQGQIDMGLGRISENFNQNILPGIQSDAVGAGQFGGGRQGVAEGIAARDANRLGSEFAQNLISQDYQQQQSRSLQALALSPQFNNAEFAPLQAFGGLLGGPNNQSFSFGSSRGDSNSKSLGF